MSTPETPPPRFLLKRLGMVAATAFLAINIWTGAPLLALWVGSRVVGRAVLSMQAVFVVVIVLAILVFSMAVALARLNAAYDRLTGGEGTRPQTRPGWMRSLGTGSHEARYSGPLSWMNEAGNEEGDDRPRLGITALEQIVVASVYLAVICLLVWFFFLAHYSVGA